MKKTKKIPKKNVRTVPKLLADLRASVASLSGEAAAEQSEPAQESEVDVEEDDTEKPARTGDRGEAATPAVVGAAFDAAVSRALRRRLLHGQALAVVVVVPTTAWVVPAAAYLRSVFGTRWHMQMRDGSDRKRNSAVGSDDVARDLSRGLCVMGVAADAGLLPAALTNAADITIRIAAPSGAVLRKAITRFSRSSPGELPDGIAAGLDLYDIIAAFRPGTGPREIARRLAAASSAGTGAGHQGRVPDLETAIEYGPARQWGLDLASQVAAFRVSAGNRAGTIKNFWREIDRGICLHSPPGMGKTLFAQVLARGCGVPLVTTSVGAWFADGPGYLDSVIKQMRSAFARAAALASPVCILFIDEIDALPDRETLSERGRDWWMPVVTDALLLLDSAIHGREGIVVIGATNAIERVDKALLRPGRLEKSVEIPRPDAAGALNILRFHLDGELSGDDLSEIGTLLEGSTGAEIMHAVRSARRTARNAGRPLSVDDLARAILPIEDIPPERLFRMSVHEAAHAVGAVVMSVGTLRHVALRTQGTSGGETVIDFSDNALSTRAMIEDRVVVGLAARVAERLLVGAESTGAGGSKDSDLGAATVLIAAVHASFGMGEDLVYLGADAQLLQEISLNRDLRDRVGRHLRELEERATRLVEANRGAVLAVAERLAAKRFLNGTEVEGLVSGRLVEESGAGSRRPPTGRRSKTSP
jgi:cell division protease FtsH